MKTIKERKIYLDDDDWKKLQSKASVEFKGKGYVSNYIRKVVNNPIAFLDDNLKEMLKVLMPQIKGS